MLTRRGHCPRPGRGLDAVRWVSWLPAIFYMLGLAAAKTSFNPPAINVQGEEFVIDDTKALYMPQDKVTQTWLLK